ncbi:MAG: trypsin-like peptidase domain-containing protein [Candidatus Yanofskybacteria bacterium]|nr:trypsin-like peptidase domain-containing protein [Candidatus Yanofskybacteria bacterium]
MIDTQKIRQFFEKLKSKNPLVLAVALVALAGIAVGYVGANIVPGFERKLDNVQSAVIGSADEQQESNQVVDLVAGSSPAVVSIIATQDLSSAQNSGPLEELCNDPFFRRFLGICNQPQTQQPQQPQREQVSAGTGFIVRADGLIITNRHVVDVENADYTVITTEGKKYNAKVLARDPFQDLAVIKIDGGIFPTVKLGNSDDVKVGQTSVAIGNALGQLSNTVSKGIISGLARSIVANSGDSSERLDEVIQTDAAINPGNSGGPLLNLNGEVIGINTAIVSGAQSIGFAIPINQAKADIEKIERTGKISYPYLGVRYILIDPEVKDQYHLNVDYGALVVQGQDTAEPAVVSGSPAAKAGLQSGDIILEMNGRKITTDYSLAQAIQSRNIGDKVTLKIRRENRDLFIETTLDEKS